MAIGAGTLNRRCTVQRREIVENTRGSARGEFVPVAGLERIACAYRELTLRELALGNGVQGVIDAVIRLRDCRAARGIIAADRVVIDDVGFSVVAPGLPDRVSGTISFQVKKVVG